MVTGSQSTETAAPAATRRRLVQRLSLGAGLGLLAGLLAWAGLWQPAERLVSDGWQRLLAPARSPARDIVVVAVDQASMEKVQRLLGHGYPWPRELYALMLCHLHHSGARAVVFDIFFEGPSPGGAELDPAQQDQALARAAAECGPVVFAYKLRPADPTPVDQDSQRLLARAAWPQAPWPELTEFARADPLAAPLLDTSARFGFANARPDPDGVVRRVQLLARAGGRLLPALALSAAALVHGVRPAPAPAHLELGGRLLALQPDGSAWLSFAHSGQDFATVPAANVLQAALQSRQGQKPLVGAERFRDRLVLVGVTAAAGYDRTSTPLTKSGNTPGVYVQAALLDNLLRGALLRPLPRGWLLLGCGLLGLLVALAGWRRGPLWSSLALLVVLGGWAALCLALLAGGRQPHTVAGWAAALAAFVTLVAVDAQRERRARRQVKRLFQYYLDPEVVRRLLARPDALALGGEARECTVLFADLVGFTTLSEQLQPEQLVELLNRYLGAITDVVLHHGGFLDKYIGDAVMAVFGAPLELADHASAACRAALDGLGRLERLNRELAAAGQPVLECRIGINTGRMVVGNVGSASRGNYTALGDAVNLAARLEGLNRVFGTRILIGPRTRELLAPELVTGELAAIRVKGKRRPVTVYQLLGYDTQLRAAERRRLERFAAALEFYRQGRLEQAREALERLLRDHPGDGPAAAYLERCRRLAGEPPVGWDPVWVMHSK